jgi:hypothetical protein
MDAQISLITRLLQGFMLVLLYSSFWRSDLKLLPLVVAPLAGLALIAIWVLPMGPVLETFGHFADQSTYVEGLSSDFVPLLAMAICYLFTGVLAGGLSRWRGAYYGVCAAGVVLLLSLQQFVEPILPLFKGRAEILFLALSEDQSGILPRLFLGIFFVWIVFFALAALAGIVGQAIGRRVEDSFRQG